MPSVHFCPVGQACPHVPQFAVSVFVFVQAPLHMSPTAHPHVLDLQICPCGQRLLHAPQLVRSTVVFTQKPPHDVVPVGQTHAPATQTFPPVHVTPQPPQLVGSVCVLTHDAPHWVVPVGHEDEQALAPHT